MVTLAVTTPFSSAARYAAALETWIPDEQDKQRIAAYQVYEDMYWSSPDTFKQTELGTNANPIVAPAAKALIEAVNRYLAVGWDLSADPTVGTPEQQAAALLAFKQLFKREDVYAKFASQKRWGLVKGDALWHITADPTKPQGSRLSLHALDPASYFPIIDDTDRLTGVYIADPVTVDKKLAIRRQAYRRVMDDSGNITITSELGYFDPGAWDDRYDDKVIPKVVQILSPEEVLPGITQLPVYRVPNTLNPGDPYGSSLLRGLERLIEGISQTITDEDLALALAGLGVYVTDAGAPVDDDGTEVPWQISPGRVIELGAIGAKFDRVTGVASVEPSIAHADWLKTASMEGASVPAVALGSVDVTTAESGIALYLKLSPLLAANAEREQAMLGVYDQMIYDLQNMWFPAYEQTKLDGVSLTTTVGDPMPENVQQKIADLNTLVTAKIMSAASARLNLTSYGFVFQQNEDALIASETQTAAAAADPFGARSAQEASSAQSDAVPAQQ